MTRHKLAWSTTLLISGLVSGCAAPSAGAASSPVTVNLSGAHICGSPTITISVTVTPTTQAEQRADNKVDATATIPVK